MTPARARERARGESAAADWTVKPATRAAQRQWEDAKKAESALMEAALQRLRTRPLDRSDNPNRTHRLRPPLDNVMIGPAKLPQWQHEVSAAGRIWYGVDKPERMIWVTLVSLRPPRETH